MKTANSDFFIARYRELRNEELVEIFQKRQNLVGEARLAIETVVKEKGIDVNAEIEETKQEQQAITIAKKARWVNSLHAVAAVLTATLSRPIETGGAITDGLLTVVAGGFGWWLSTRFVKKVREQGIEKRKKTVMLFFPGYIILYTVVYVILWGK